MKYYCIFCGAEITRGAITGKCHSCSLQGRTAWNKGLKWDDIFGKEKADKKREANRLRSNPESITKMVATRKKRGNYKCSKEHRKKISDALKGRKFSKEFCRNVSLGRLGTKMPISGRIKMSLAKGGDGDINRLNIQRANPNFRACSYWKRQVLKRDNYLCQNCFKSGRKLEVHHIYQYSKFPKLRNKISNGITLCSKCHNISRGIEDLYRTYLFKYILCI